MTGVVQGSRYCLIKGIKMEGISQELGFNENRLVPESNGCRG